MMQEYEKQMKSFGIGMGSTPSSGASLRQGSQTGSNLAASLANSKKRVVSSQSMLESRYSKTFIYTPQAKEVKVKEVRCLQLLHHISQLGLCNGERGVIPELKLPTFLSLPNFRRLS